MDFSGVSSLITDDGATLVCMYVCICIYVCMHVRVWWHGVLIQLE